jgi:MFS family permease
VESDRLITEPRQRWTLALERGGCAAGRVDALVVATALRTIRVDLGASLEQLEWTVNAYVLSFAVLMMSAAALGDRIALSEPPPACARGCRRPCPKRPT